MALKITVSCFKRHLLYSFSKIQSPAYSILSILKYKSLRFCLRKANFKQHTSIIYNYTLSGNLSRFEQRRIKRKSLEKRVIGPLEFLLTNYPKVAISYVTKEESVSDFSEAVSSASYGMYPKATV